MPLFRNTEPDLRAIIAYIVARSLDRGITLTQTKLVKLLYLVDVDRAASRAKPLTGLRWVFFHYGPYALELPETLSRMEGSEIITRRYGDAILYSFAPGAPSGDDWVAPAQRCVDRVVARFAALEQNELLNHVYFHTGPMIGAKRGEPLDLARAADYKEPQRRAALRPPAAPPDVRERLEKWREATSKRLAPVELDPPGRFFDDPAEELSGEGVSGRLFVPDGTAL